jgi:hypothetical protein
VLAGPPPQITVPVTITNGRRDRLVPLANAEFLDQRRPSSRLMIIDAAHFAARPWRPGPPPVTSWSFESAPPAQGRPDPCTSCRSNSYVLLIAHDIGGST